MGTAVAKLSGREPPVQREVSPGAPMSGLYYYVLTILTFHYCYFLL